MLEAAVFGLPHRILGEEVAAAVLLKEGASVCEEDLRQHLARQLAAHKIPKIIDIRLDELPKNASGKVLKRVLRDELAEFAGTVQASRHDD